jgi:hypothetical protein
MRTIAVIGAILGLGFAPAALADRPGHTIEEFSGVDLVPAGTFCDFDYESTFTIRTNLIVFGDPADPARVILHLGFTLAHKNVDTGFTLTEKGIVTIHSSAEDAREKITGIGWHLRDASGKIVLVQAGQVVTDTETGEVLKFTPNLTPGSATTICPALGGAPAT